MANNNADPQNLLSARSSSVSLRSSLSKHSGDISFPRQKKRVTIQSETTILLLQDHGHAIITRNAPYFKKGCRTNVRLVANLDTVISICDMVFCLVAIGFALVILEDSNAKGSYESFHGAYSPKELLHAFIIFGILLLCIYLFEITVARKLHQISTDEDIGRKESIRRARNWRCGNFVLIILELFFCATSSLRIETLVPGCLLLCGGCLRLIGICIAHQYIQEMETVAVAPMVPALVVENQPDEPEEPADAIPVVHENPRRLSVNAHPGERQPAKTIPSLMMPQEPAQFLGQT